MKLQWLPRPSTDPYGCGWELATNDRQYLTYDGFDRFGDIRATVMEESTDKWVAYITWKVDENPPNAECKKDAMLLAESKIEDE